MDEVFEKRFPNIFFFKLTGIRADHLTLLRLKKRRLNIVEYNNDANFCRLEIKNERSFYETA